MPTGNWWIGVPSPSDVAVGVGVGAGRRGDTIVGLGVSENAGSGDGSPVCCEGAANAAGAKAISSNNPRRQIPHSSLRSISSLPSEYEVHQQSTSRRLIRRWQRLIGHSLFILVLGRNDRLDKPFNQRPEHVLVEPYNHTQHDESHGQSGGHNKIP